MIAELRVPTDDRIGGPRLHNSPVSIGGVVLAGENVTRRRVDRGGAQGDLGV